MSSSRMPYLFTILMGSLDPFPCLSEDEPPPEFDPRPEFRPDEDRGLFFCELDLEFDWELDWEPDWVWDWELDFELDCEPDWGWEEPDLDLEFDWDWELGWDWDEELGFGWDFGLTDGVITFEDGWIVKSFSKNWVPTVFDSGLEERDWTIFVKSKSDVWLSNCFFASK